MIPAWLHILSWISLILAFVSAGIILVDMAVRGGQKMGIMNVVWPVTALYWGPVAVWGYGKTGIHLRGGKRDAGPKGAADGDPEGGTGDPTAAQAALSVSHCGAGCTLGDIAAEFLVAGTGLAIAGARLWSDYVLDFTFAWLLGIAFQYFVIRPMKKLPRGEALKAAIKADTLSIVAFEIGLFGWMALTWFVFFPSPHLEVTQPEYWFMMQVGMVLGFFTAWPANVWLLRRGLKETMG